MDDKFEKLYEEVAKLAIETGEMIGWIAERTLSFKEYKEFYEKFSGKAESNEVLDKIGEIVKKDER